MYPSVCFWHFSSPTGTSASEENTILKVQPKGGSILRRDWGQYYKNDLTDRCPAGGSISRSKNPCIIIIIIISPPSSSSFDFGTVPVMSVCLECWAFICTQQKKASKMRSRPTLRNSSLGPFSPLLQKMLGRNPSGLVDEIRGNNP